MSQPSSLQLDTRQRAMLAEMGVRVWLPEGAVAAPQVPAAVQAPVSLALADMAQAAAPVSLQHAGPASRTASATTASPPAAAIPARASSGAGFTPGPLPLLQALDWPALVQAAGSCQACAMCQGRKNTVLHVPEVAGQTADWLVLGEAPDADEDSQGQPWVGEAGVLLDNILAVLGLQRLRPREPGADAQAADPARSVYASHALQCRPPAGSSPQLAEVRQCRAFVEREIALLRPKVIVAMGRLAALAMLADRPELLAQPMGKQRGTVHRFQGIPVVITYSPHYLLRNSADKAKAWLDWNLAADAVEAAAP